MDDLSPRGSLRDRILNDLRSTVKQIYHESVNKELSKENKTYLCLSLLKHVDEALRHGLKQLHLGYWRAVQRVVHRHALEAVDQMPTHGSVSNAEYSSQTKGRAWLAVSLSDDSFTSYMECLARESMLDKYYETWSIIRNNDACNCFLSIISGLDNVSFTFDMEYSNKPPRTSDFSHKNTRLEDPTPLRLQLANHAADSRTSVCSVTSPGDSGVVLPDSGSDMEQAEADYINGNTPEPVKLRKRKKDTKRHVSFHEDIICKSPDKCRKLRWDCENQRYSWSGEELELATPFVKGLDISERGAPEGEETPTGLEHLGPLPSHKSIIVRRFLQSIKKQTKIRQLSSKYAHQSASLQPRGSISRAEIDRLNGEIDREIESNRSRGPDIEPGVVKELGESVYRVLRLRDGWCALSDAALHVWGGGGRVAVPYGAMRRVVVYPGCEAFDVLSDHRLRVVGPSAQATREVLGALAWCSRQPCDFRQLTLEELAGSLGRVLAARRFLAPSDPLAYFGVVRLEKEVAPPDTRPSVKRGSLMYRDVRAGDQWAAGDFQLKNSVLYLFAEDKSPRLAMNLAASCQSCSRVSDSGRPHTLQLVLSHGDTEFHSSRNCFYEDSALRAHWGPPGSVLQGVKARWGRWFGPPRPQPCVVHLAASDEDELTEWLDLLVQASCGDPCVDAGREDVVDCCLLASRESLLLFTEPELGSVEVVSCAQIADISALRTGPSEEDGFVLVEFSCLEAGTTSGDWTLHFGSGAMLTRFLGELGRQWRLEGGLPGEVLTEGRLLAACRSRQAALARL